MKEEDGFLPPTTPPIKCGSSSNDLHDCFYLSCRTSIWSTTWVWWLRMGKAKCYTILAPRSLRLCSVEETLVCFHLSWLNHFAPALFPGCRGYHVPPHPNSYTLQFTCISNLPQKLHILKNKAWWLRTWRQSDPGANPDPTMDYCTSYPCWGLVFSLKMRSYYHSWGFARITLANAY